MDRPNGGIAEAGENEALLRMNCSGGTSVPDGSVPENEGARRIGLLLRRNTIRPKADAVPVLVVRPVLPAL